MRDDRARISDILEAIDRIDKYSAEGYETFLNDELIQTWILHHLQIIGEAASKLSVEFKGSNPAIEWKQIGGFRNILVHHYFEIDHSLVWQTVQKNLPDLKLKLQKILETSERKSR